MRITELSITLANGRRLAFPSHGARPGAHAILGREAFLASARAHGADYTAFVPGRPYSRADAVFPDGSNRSLLIEYPNR